MTVKLRELGLCLWFSAAVVHLQHHHQGCRDPVVWQAKLPTQSQELLSVVPLVGQVKEISLVCEFLACEIDLGEGQTWSRSRNLSVLFCF